MSAAGPDAFDRLGERVADRVNPIVVKEVRQGLRTRTFWVFFSLMLVACLFIALVAFGVARGEGERSGKGAFIATFVCLGIVQFFVIPYAAYRSMAREADDETWVLLQLTGLGPRRILGGKLGSAVLQGALYSSAATPFLLFSYFLNGIDLPTIVAAVVLSLAYQVFLVSVAVSLATLAETKLVRALLNFVLLGVLIQGLGLGIGGAVALGELARSLSSSPELWLGVLATLCAMVTTAVLLFEAAAARLSLVTEDYARGPRLAYLVQYLALLGFLLWGWQQTNEVEVLFGASLALCAYSTFVGLFVVSDRDGMARVHWATGGRWALLKPGGLRGYVLVVTLLLLGTGACAALAVADGSMRDGPLMALVAAPAFSLLLLALPPLVARWFPHPPWQTPMMVRVVFLGLLVLLTGVPPLVGQLLAEPDAVLLNLLNPIVGLANIHKHGLGGVSLVLLTWGVAAGVGVAAFFSLRGRDREWLT